MRVWMLTAVVLATTPFTAHADDREVGVRFSSADRTLIVEYLSRERGTANERGARGGGGQGRKSLPPGIAKNLARGKPLPPGLATRPLPKDLAQRIEPPKGCEVLVVDGRVLLVEVATRVIRDVIADAVLR